MFSVTGQVLSGRYEISSMIGAGGMAEVYRARHIQLDRWVAVKIMHRFLAKEPQFKARFEREARLVAQLHHPNIIQVYDYDAVEDQQLYYMVVELIEGPSLNEQLADLAKNGQWLPIPEVLRIAKDVANALGYAHKQGMTHRDVKPANVLMESGRRVVLSDFGLARLVAGTHATLTGSGVMVGTPAYMSPEQGLGDPGDARSDIYSLGVMLYQMATNQLPFVADTPVGVVLRHVNDAVELPNVLNAAVPPGLVAIILRCMAKAPDDRYQTAGELVADLEAPDQVPLLTPPAKNASTIILPKAGVAPSPTSTASTSSTLSSGTGSTPVQRVKRRLVLNLVGALALIGVACIAGIAISRQFPGIGRAIAIAFNPPSPTPSPSMTSSSTWTATSTTTHTPNPTVTATTTHTSTAFPTATPTAPPMDTITATDMPTNTPMDISTDVSTSAATDSSSETPTGTPSDTATPCLVTAKDVAVNIRSGPGTVYYIIGGLQPGNDPLTVTGAFPSADDPLVWWQVNASGQTGWVSGVFTATNGPCDPANVPKATLPPLPQPTPNPPTETPANPTDNGGGNPPPPANPPPTDNPTIDITPTDSPPTDSPPTDNPPSAIPG